MTALNRRTRVLLVTGDRLGSAMAGPAIRAVEAGRVLAEDCDVTVATLEGGSLEEVPFTTAVVDEDSLQGLIAQTDVLVAQGYFLERHPWVAETDVCLVVDAYDPFHLETLEWERYSPEPVRWGNLDAAVHALTRQLRRADLVLCASEKQRDLWMGQLAGLGRVNPATYDADTTMRQLVDVVPFGLPARPPLKTAPALRGVVPGIGEDDQVLLWGGGVYNWFDPLTLVRAVHALRASHPRIRLVFMGMRHPVDGIPEMRIATELRRLTAELGLEGSHVFFNERWVPYSERQNYLLEADIGVSCHLDHVETAYSFRTRILDYLWAGLPVVSTAGDSFAPLIEGTGAGFTVPPGDVAELASAIARLLDDPEGRERAGAASRSLGSQFTWDRALGPLLAYCRAPRRAADSGQRADRQLSPPNSEPDVTPSRNPGVARIRSYAARAGALLRREGITGVIRRSTRAFR